MEVSIPSELAREGNKPAKIFLGTIPIAKGLAREYVLKALNSGNTTIFDLNVPANYTEFPLRSLRDLCGLEVSVDSLKWLDLYGVRHLIRRVCQIEGRLLALHYGTPDSPHFCGTYIATYDTVSLTGNMTLTVKWDTDKSA